MTGYHVKCLELDCWHVSKFRAMMPHAIRACKKKNMDLYQLGPQTPEIVDFY